MLVNFIFKRVNKYTIVSPELTFVSDRILKQLSQSHFSCDFDAARRRESVYRSGKINSETAVRIARNEKLIAENKPR